MFHPKCVGLVTQTGGRTAHAIVVANDRNIPCVLNIDTTLISPGDTIEIDGEQGLVLIEGGADEFEAQEGLALKDPTHRYVWQNGNVEVGEVSLENTELNGHAQLASIMMQDGRLDFMEPIAGGVVYSDGEVEQFSFDGRPIPDQDMLDQ